MPAERWFWWDLRGSSEVQRKTQMLLITLQARHIGKVSAICWTNRPPSLGAGGRFEFSYGRCSDKTNSPVPNAYSSPTHIRSGNSERGSLHLCWVLCWVQFIMRCALKSTTLIGLKSVPQENKHVMCSFPFLNWCHPQLLYCSQSRISHTWEDTIQSYL